MDKMRIPVFMKKGQNSNVYTDSARIPMFKSRSSDIPMFERIRLYHKCLSKTFGEFYYLDAEDQNSNSYSYRAKIPVCERITQELRRV